MAPSPIIRINWRRRRSNSFAFMARYTSMPIGLRLPGNRPQRRQLLEAELGGDPEILDEFCVRRLVVLGIANVGIGGCPADRQDVRDDLRQRFAIECRPHGTPTGAEPETVGEAGRPIRHCGGTQVEFDAVTGQQQRQSEVPRAQSRERRRKQTVECLDQAAGRRRLRFQPGKNRIEPDVAGMLAEHGDKRREAPMRFRGAHSDTFAFERLSDVFVLQGSLCIGIPGSRCYHSIDPQAARHYHPVGMSEDSYRDFDKELKRLEGRLDELVDICAQLKEENRSLKQRQDALIGERATLLQKNEQVRARVEAMIGRLKAMESSS